MNKTINVRRSNECLSKAKKVLLESFSDKHEAIDCIFECYKKEYRARFVHENQLMENNDSNYKKPINIAHASSIIDENDSTSALETSHQLTVIDESGTDNGNSQNQMSSTNEYTKFLNVIRRGKLSTEHTICRALKLLKGCSDKSFIKDIIRELGNDIIEDISEEKLKSLHAINVANDIATFVEEDWLSNDKFYMACNKFLDPSSASRIITMFTGATMSQHRDILQPEGCSDTSITHLYPTHDSDTSQVRDALVLSTFVAPQSSETITSNACIQSHNVSPSDIPLQDIMDIIEDDNRDTCDQSTSIAINPAICNVNAINESEYWPEQVSDFIMHSRIELSDMMKAIVNCNITTNELIYYRLKLRKKGVRPEIVNSAIYYLRERIYKFKESDRSKILDAIRDSGRISRYINVRFKSNKKLKNLCYKLLENELAASVLSMLLEPEDIDINELVDGEDIDINELIDGEDIDINELVDEESIDDIEASIKQDLFSVMFFDEYPLPELLKSENSAAILEGIRQVLILPKDLIYTRKKLLDLGVSKQEIRYAFMSCKKKLMNGDDCSSLLQQYLHAFSISEKVFRSLPHGYIKDKTFALFIRMRLGELSHELVKELWLCLKNDLGKHKANSVLRSLANMLIKENPERKYETIDLYIKTSISSTHLV